MSGALSRAEPREGDPSRHSAPVAAARLARAVPIIHLVLILVVAALLRAYDLGRYSLWHDEVVAMRMARTTDPISLIRLLDQIDGTRAPLHPLLLQAWCRVFGASETAGRSFSAVCGVLTVGLVFLLGKRLLGEAAGRWGAWFAAVCPPLVYYSREARMYALLVLLTCCAWLSLAGFRTVANRKLMVLYGLLLSLLVYTHPLGLFMVAAHGLAYLAIRRLLLLGLRPWLLIQLGVALAIAPWLPRYLDHGTDFPIPLYSIRFLLAVPLEYIGGDSLVLLACGAIIGIGLVSLDGRRLHPDRLAENALLLVWMLAPPVLMFVVSRLARPIFGPPRYHLFIAPAYLLLLAGGLCKLSPWIRLPLAMSAFFLSFNLMNANVYAQVVKADWRGLARWLDTQERGVTVVLHPGDPRFPLVERSAAEYYLSPRHRIEVGQPAPSPHLPEAARATAEPLVLDVDCLTAQQVREGVRGDPGVDVPEFYGLIVSRR